MTNEPTPVSLRAKPGPDRLAVTGIGNALLDIIMRDHDQTYERLGLIRASMNLVDLDRAHEILDAMGPTIQMSGGSVANTIAGVAALGGTAGFIGKVADDEFGEVFTHDFESMGVEVDLALAEISEGATGRCHVFVGDDAQRTMATYLGAANQLQVHDVHERLIARSEITYIEGYLFDLPPAKEAIHRVVEIAHEHDSMVALSLSDSFCVERHRRDFLELVTNDVDVLLCIAALIVAADDGLGPSGARIVTMSGGVHVPAAHVEHVVDQNGAGDLFASGFLYGLAIGADPVEAANLGSLCAGEVIKHLGARPESDLEAVAIDGGLL